MYHLSEFENQRNRRYAGPSELFNHRHAQLRNVVERAFGVLKMRFKCLRCTPHFPFPTQARIVLACCIIHNFIRRTQGKDMFFKMIEAEIEDAGSEKVEEGIPSVIEDIRRGDELRGLIAGQLWACRQVYTETSFFAVMGRFSLYAVARGRRPGLYSSWEDCEAQVKGFSGAIHAGIRSIEEANEFFCRHGVAPVCALLNPTYPEIQLQRSDEDVIPAPVLTNAPPIGPHVSLKPGLGPFMSKPAGIIFWVALFEPLKIVSKPP
ncbi:hypothetical protein QJS10_CPB17g01032 [Acorus calamus]|uniref:DDE Tnp4 domain-containing protein n=1 Tax=Acorus calamus TaxID=4465 RepID=A0AAV9CXS8_ACOCL|nr:hypothetical protein QJS10_CPB17g01032 [Acorus calamus]